MTDAYDEVVSQFQEWVEGYVADVGDAAIATARLKVLNEVKRSISYACTELEKLIADEVGTGMTETPFGAVTVRQSAERYEYPKATEDEFKDLFRHVVSRLLDKIETDPEVNPERREVQMANMIEQIWPLGARQARTAPLKKLTGLKIYEYRKAIGRKAQVQIH